MCGLLPRRSAHHSATPPKQAFRVPGRTLLLTPARSHTHTLTHAHTYTQSRISRSRSCPHQRHQRSRWHHFPAEQNRADAPTRRGDRLTRHSHGCTAVHRLHRWTPRPAPQSDCLLGRVAMARRAAETMPISEAFRAEFRIDLEPRLDLGPRESDTHPHASFLPTIFGLPSESPRFKVASSGGGPQGARRSPCLRRPHPAASRGRTVPVRNDRRSARPTPTRVR